MLKKRPHLIPALIAALMLFGALGRWPYGYYQLLRLVTCGAAIFVAFMAYNWKKLWATWLFGFIAVLFNPLVKIHFHKDTWQVIDIIAAVLFIVSLFAVYLPKDKSS